MMAAADNEHQGRRIEVLRDERMDIFFRARSPSGAGRHRDHRERQRRAPPAFSWPLRGVIDEDAWLHQAGSSRASFGRARSASLERSAHNAARGGSLTAQHLILSRRCRYSSSAPRDPPFPLSNSRCGPPGLPSVGCATSRRSQSGSSPNNSPTRSDITSNSPVGGNRGARDWRGSPARRRAPLTGPLCDAATHPALSRGQRAPATHPLCRRLARFRGESPTVPGASRREGRLRSKPRRSSDPKSRPLRGASPAHDRRWAVALT